MAILYVPQTLLISGILMVVVISWILVFYKSDENRFQPYHRFLYVGALFSILFGVWMWQFFSQPNNVSFTWFFILMNLIIASVFRFLTIGQLNKDTITQRFATIALALVFFLISKVFIVVGIMMLFIAAANPEKGELKNTRIIKGIIIVTVVLSVLTIGSLAIYTNKDDAVYFDELLTYDTGLPFHTRVDGAHLRVVDYELASSIMLKSNTLGSNTKITDIHLGKINGATYWIGAVSFSGNKFLRSDLNHYQGFIAVDFVDPQIAPLHIDQKFNIGPELAMNKKLKRVVYDYNPNYIIGDNVYFSMDDNKEMKLVVPYSIQSFPYFAQKGAGIVTQEIKKVGGIMIFNADGELDADYSVSEFDELPSFAQVQFFPETWLEREIDHWGRSITAFHEFGVLTHLGWIWKSPLLMGIDDDVRVIIDPDTEENVQFILLDSTGSDNQILRGGIKANSSGIFFFDFSNYGFIDTNTAHEHGVTGLTNFFGNTLHGYNTLLPVLYPIIDNPKDLNDYAYVMPLQFQNTRFGGIAITDPADKTGVHTSVRVVETDTEVNITSILDRAIEDYLKSSIGLGEATASFNVEVINSFVTDGNTQYVMRGNLTRDGNSTNETVVFSQEFITDIQQWIKVVNTEPGDTLFISVVVENGVNYASYIEI